MTTERRLLNLTRVETEGLPLLRIESAWADRPATVFHSLEVDELCEGLKRLWPEHFPFVEVKAAGEPTYCPPEEPA